MSERVDLHAYLGLDETGNLQLCVSPWVISKLSPMHKRGQQMPETVIRFIETGDGDCRKILEDLNHYYQPKKQKK